MEQEFKKNYFGFYLSAVMVVLAACSAVRPIAVPTQMKQPATTTSAPAVNESQKQLSAVPPQRLARLAKSVNITRWFWFPEGTSADYFKNYMTDADLKLIRDMGVLSVRLVISPTFFYQPDKPAELNPTMIGYLDSAVDRLLAHDLAVVIDMHDQDKDAWEHNQKYVDGFMTFWPTLASRYADRDSDRVIFEMLNEPVFDQAADRWAKIQATWVERMRQVVPSHTLIVTGNEWGGISGLNKLSPLADKNLVYSFHFYDPMQFTHQGATWAGPGLETLRDVPYPATPERCKPTLEKTTDSGRKSSLRIYCYSYITASKLKSKLAEAADWGTQHDVPLWMGEFGVYCPNAPAQDRAQWIQDVRTSVENLKIGWALWGYDECFGMQRKLKNGVIELDTSVVQALGLNPP